MKYQNFDYTCNKSYIHILLTRPGGGMVDTYVSDAYAARCEGSSPFLGTKENQKILRLPMKDFYFRTSLHLLIISKSIAFFFPMLIFALLVRLSATREKNFLRFITLP